MRRACVLALALGCGRIDFGALGSADSARGDIATDVTRGDGGYCATLPPGFCSTITAAALCDDFDTDTAIGEGWTTTTLQNGGTQSLSTAQACSGSTSAMHSFPDQLNGNSIAQLEYDQTVASSVDFSFDLLIPMRTPSSQIEIANITLMMAGIGNTNTDFMLDVGNGTMDSFHEEYFPDAGMSSSADHLFPEIAGGAWHHVEVEIDFSAQTETATIDGVVIYSGATAYAVQPGELEVDSGIVYAFGVLDGWTIYVDDVVIRVT